MLPRDHDLSTEQLVQKVHKDMYCAFEFMGGNLDKVGNGFAAFFWIVKRTSAQMSERIRKELDKRAFQNYSRKLFSIYRFKIAKALPTK